MQTTPFSGGFSHAHLASSDFPLLHLAHAEMLFEVRLRLSAPAITRLEDFVGDLADAQKRTEQRVEELAEAQKRTEQRVEELAEAQKRT
ncbi:MAG: hypothetical protein RMJ60_00515, partial [Anaerolineales bacterium]|nr:hypothetical protein [Anaerolineales bacterium]